jgi:hypothetical protein
VLGRSRETNAGLMKLFMLYLESWKLLCLPEEHFISHKTYRINIPAVFSLLFKKKKQNKFGVSFPYILLEAVHANLKEPLGMLITRLFHVPFVCFLN